MVLRMMLTDLSDDALITSLEGIHGAGNGLLARMILHLMEVEERRLHLKAAYPSMFDFCTRRLGMGEGAAFRRLSAARLARRFPRLLASLERGDVSLETLVLVRNHLTDANVDEVLMAVTRKSKREVEEILARRAPQPDAPSMMRKLPGSAAAGAPAAGTSAEATGTGSGAPGVAAAAGTSGRTAAATRGRIEPIAEGRYKLQITASSELSEKIERARALLRHRNPSGDLSIVIERALDALIEKLEKERLGKSARQQGSAKVPGPAVPRAPAARSTRASCASARPGISRATRREVFERDGEQCTFVSPDGARCPSRAFLELDHVEPRALGGADDAANLRVLCRAHNALHAEERFGRTVVERGMSFRRQKSAQRNATAGDTLDAAKRGLTNMGFCEREARQALAVVAARHPQAPPAPLEGVLREALAVLTERRSPGRGSPERRSRSAAHVGAAP